MLHDQVVLYSWPFTLGATVLAWTMLLTFIFRFAENQGRLMATGQGILMGIGIGPVFWLPLWGLFHLLSWLFDGVPAYILIPGFYILYGFLILTAILFVISFISSED